MEGDLGWCRGGGSSSNSSNNNWDLHAVVRFACGGPGAQVQGASSSPPPSDGSFSWPSPVQQPQWHDDPAVDELFQALLAAPEPQPSSPRNEAPTTHQQPAPARPRSSGRGGGGPTRSKRKSKKSQVKKEVTRVAAGAPSADLWAWRKYGQKPIKGSPYPRGYYRCSTDKDCKARKQVERCRADPATLIVTYTGDHSHPVPLHRNSLAGTTRAAKPSQQQQQQAQSPPPSDSAGLSAPSPTDDSTNKPQGSPASACDGLSPATPLRSPSVGVEYEVEEEDTCAVRLLLEDTDMAAEDDALMLLQPDVVLPPKAKSDEPAPSDGNNVELFPNNKPGEPQPTTVSAGTSPVVNFVEEKFSVSSGLSAWEAAAATGWVL